MPKKILILISFLILFTSTTFADETKTTAAVSDLEAQEGVSKGVANLLTDYLRTHLVNTNQFIIVTRENMEQILKEQNFQMSGCTSQECIVQVGQLLGVRKMFTGSIGKIGATYLVNLKMIDIESGKIERAETEQCAECKEDVLLISIKNVANGIIGFKGTTGSVYAGSQAIRVTAQEVIDKITQNRETLDSYRATINIRTIANAYPDQPSICTTKEVYKKPDKLKESSEAITMIYNGKKYYAKSGWKSTVTDVDPSRQAHSPGLYNDYYDSRSINAEESKSADNLYVLTLVPKTDASYKMKITVDYKTGCIVKIQTFDVKGELRSTQNTESQLINGGWMMKRIEIVTDIGRTIMTYDQVQVNIPISDDEFKIEGKW